MPNVLPELGAKSVEKGGSSDTPLYCFLLASPRFPGYLDCSLEVSGLFFGSMYLSIFSV